MDDGNDNWYINIASKMTCIGICMKMLFNYITCGSMWKGTDQCKYYTDLSEAHLFQRWKTKKSEDKNKHQTSNNSTLTSISK